MTRQALAERFLAAMSGKECAAAIIGDIDEALAPQSCWALWRVVLPIAVRLGWRVGLAVLLATLLIQPIFGSLYSAMLLQFMHHADRPHWYSLTIWLVPCVATFWAMAFVSLVRFGPSNRRTWLAFCLAALVSFALISGGSAPAVLGCTTVYSIICWLLEGKDAGRSVAIETLLATLASCLVSAALWFFMALVWPAAKETQPNPLLSRLHWDLKSTLTILPATCLYLTMQRTRCAKLQAVETES